MLLLVEDSITVKSQKMIDSDEYKVSWEIECKHIKDFNVRINLLPSDGVYRGYIFNNGKKHCETIFWSNPAMLCAGSYYGNPTIFLLSYWDFLCKLGNVNGKVKSYYIYGIDKEKEYSADKDYLLELKNGRFRDKIVE